MSACERSFFHHFVFFHSLEFILIVFYFATNKTKSQFIAPTSGMVIISEIELEVN